LSAQLPVTALIVARGGYKDVAPQVPSDLRHVHIGGRKVAEVGAVHKETSVEQLVADVETTIVKLFQKYSNPEWAYLSKPRIQFIKATTYEDATDRLARRAEWANAEDSE
jgi:ATP-dependent helicase/nuclease subunit B